MGACPTTPVASGSGWAEEGPYLYDRPLIISEWPVLRNNYAARRAEIDRTVTPPEPPCSKNYFAVVVVAIQEERNGHPISIYSVAMFVVGECGKISQYLMLCSGYRIEKNNKSSLKFARLSCPC